MLVPNPSSSNFTFKVNRLLTLTLVFMAMGTVTELALIGHYEDAWQLVPILLISASLLTFVVLKWSASNAIHKLFKGLMIGCVISGVIGIWFHFKANMEFEKELHPSASGIDLLIESLSGALPTLAPGSMMVFGAIGFIYTLLIIKQPK